MRINVTRAEVVKAIKTEPLLAGSWVHSFDRDTTKFKNNTNCPVCAVGSILDCKLGKKIDADTLDSMGSDIVEHGLHDSMRSYVDFDGVRHKKNVRELTALAKDLAQAGRPLSALSSLFEELSDRHEYTDGLGFANYRLRRILINFVKKNFPSKLTIDTKKVNRY